MKIICFGDSNTWGYDPRGYFGGRYDHPWTEILAEQLRCTLVNQGENGREIPAMPVDFPADADLVIVMLGTNDLLQGVSPETVCGRMERFLGALHRKDLLLLAPPPMKSGAWVPHRQLIENSESLAACYRSLADRMGIGFIDTGQWHVPLAYDGVHFTEEGHTVFAGELYRVLMNKLPF